MIDVKSLRVGNWVQLTDEYFSRVGSFYNPAKYQLVESVMCSGINAGGAHDGSLEPDFEEKDIDGIPLTPEILEKCGAEKDDKSQFGGYLIRLSGGEQIRIVHDDINGWHWPMFGHTVVKVNYLHQLQNLIYDLDGEELDIEL